MDYETPDPQSFIHTDDSEEGLNDFVQVPENVDEMSSSPELINIEDDGEEVVKNVNDFIVSKDEEESRADLQVTKNEEEENRTDDNLEREIDDQELFPVDSPKIQNLTSGVEDIGIKPSPHKLGGSPSRPSTKTVETPRATGYLSFLNALHPFVLYLIYWRDTKLSVLSLGVTMIVLLTLYVNTVLHTVVLMLLAAMVVSLVYIVTKIAIDSFYNKQIVNPFHKYLEQEITLPEDDIIKITQVVVKRLNCYFSILMKTIFFEETLRSLKFMVALFLVSYFTNYLNVLVSLFISVTMMFTIPPLYNKYQKPVDNVISKVLSKVTDIYSSVVEKIPFLPKLKSD